MAKPSAEERAHTAKLQAEAREADARAKAATAKREAAEQLTDLLTDVARSVNRSSSSDLAERLGTVKEPRRFGGGILVKIAPSVVDRFLVRNGGKKIPDDFWQLDDDDHAVIACPCGKEPRIALGSIMPCGGEGCARVFFFIGREVRVAGLSPEEISVFEAPYDCPDAGAAREQGRPGGGEGTDGGADQAAGSGPQPSP